MGSYMDRDTTGFKHQGLMGKKIPHFFLKLFKLVRIISHSVGFFVFLFFSVLFFFH